MGGSENDTPVTKAGLNKLTQQAYSSSRLFFDLSGFFATAQDDQIRYALDDQVRQTESYMESPLSKRL